MNTAVLDDFDVEVQQLLEGELISSSDRLGRALDVATLAVLAAILLTLRRVVSFPGARRD